MPAGPKSVADPHKELRFTRGAQASLFALLGAVCCGATVAILLINLLLSEPLTPRWWPLVPLPAAALFFRLAIRCARHAYIILTPLGIEIFPFFKARDNLQVLYWSQIAGAEVNERDQLVIHLDEARRSGVVASLAPIPAGRRALLARAIEGRMNREPDEGDSPH